MKVFESERLVIRNWETSDIDDLYEYASSELVGPNAGWEPHKNIKESEKILEMFMANDEVYAIEHKEENKVIGGIGLHRRCPDINRLDLKQVEIGYVLNPNYWGRGYMPEAVNSAVKYCFEVLNLDLIWCGHYDFNLNSKRVNEKCGFEYKFKKIEILKELDNKEVTTHYYNIENSRRKNA